MTGPRAAGDRRALERGKAGAGGGARGPRGALPPYLLGAASCWPRVSRPVLRALGAAAQSGLLSPALSSRARCRRRRGGPRPCGSRQAKAPPQSPGADASPARSRSRPPPRCVRAAASVPSARRGDAAPLPAPGSKAHGPGPPVRGARAPMSPVGSVPGACHRGRRQLGAGVAALSGEWCGAGGPGRRPSALPS